MWHWQCAKQVNHMCVLKEKQQKSPSFPQIERNNAEFSVVCKKQMHERKKKYSTQRNLFKSQSMLAAMEHIHCVSMYNLHKLGCVCDAAILF